MDVSKEDTWRRSSSTYVKDRHTVDSHRLEEEGTPLSLFKGKM